MSTGHVEHRVQKLIFGSSAVMARLSTVKVVALSIPAFLLARKAGAKTASRVRASCSTVTLAIRPVLLVLAPIGLGLLPVKISIQSRKRKETTTYFPIL